MTEGTRPLPGRADIPPFHAMEMAGWATEREATGASVIHLEVGQPSAPAPLAVREAAMRALERDQIGYTSAPGLLSLREAIARHYRDWYGVDVDPAHIVVTAGASAGFTLAFLACFEPGQRVGVVEPGYPCYRNTLQALGVEPVAIPVGPDTRWAPTPEVVEAAGPLDGLVVASPSNPTGTVLPAERFAALAGWCQANGVQLVSDEIYHGITYGQRAESALALDRGAVVVSSFSKYFCMTGWRLGWITAPPSLMAAVERFQQNLYICAPTLSQLAAVAAFGCTEELDGHVTRYAANRRLLLDGLAAAGVTDRAAADGAFYVYADVSDLTGPAGTSPRRRPVDSLDLCRRWLDEAGVATTPGIDFDLVRGHRFVRFSYSGRGEDIAEGCRRLEAWASTAR
jgi:aspartate/methionine/tyrosine aminotransferase